MIKAKTIFIFFITLTIFTACTALCSANEDTGSLDTFVPAVIYTDADDIVKYAVFFTGSGAVPSGITVSAGDTVFDITSEKSAGNMLYQPITSGSVLTHDKAEVKIMSGEESLVYSDIPVIEIVEGNPDDWTAGTSGHVLLFYKGSESDIVIPNFLNGVPIAAIGGGTASNNGSEYYVNIENDAAGLKSAKISEGILYIQPCTFYGESSLTSVVLPDTVREIRQAAFAETPLTGSLTLPKNLTVIGRYAFYGCTKLTGSLTVPGGVKNISDAAFYNCKGFKGALVLEDGVEGIGELTFGAPSGSMGFTSLTLPSTLKKIGCYAFQMCSKVKNELVLPEGLEVISDGAFDHMSAISNEVLVIPSTVKMIGGDYNVKENTGYSGHVFYDMGTNANFKRFEVAEGNTEFTAVDGVLYSADMTRMIGYPRGKTDERFVLPDTVTQIDELAFSRAAYLKTLVLPDSYVISTVVPDNVLNHDGNSLAVGLYVYTSIENIEVNDTNPNYTSIDGQLYSKGGETLMYVPNNHKGNFAIAEGCEKIEKGAFYAVYSNIGWEEITLPSTLSETDPDAAEFLNTCIQKKAAATLKPTDNGIYSVNEYGYLTGPYAKGDINLSGTVDDIDMTILLRYSLGIKPLDFNLSQADMNGSGKADMLDAAVLAKHT